MKKILLLFLLIVISFCPNSYADTETEEVINAYNDIYLMFDSGITYSEFRPHINNANLKFNKYKQKHINDAQYSDIIVKLGWVNVLYKEIESTWYNKIFSGMTDISLTKQEKEIYPKLKVLRGDIWGKYDTDTVLDIFISYQGEKINDAKQAARDLDNKKAN